MWVYQAAYDHISKLIKSSVLYFIIKLVVKSRWPWYDNTYDITPVTHTWRDWKKCLHKYFMGCRVYGKTCSTMLFKILPFRSRVYLFQYCSFQILPGSLVHTDCHRAFTILSQLGPQHFTGNSLRNLEGPDGVTKTGY